MALIRGFDDVRYHARNVERSLAFYTRLGFTLDFADLPAFAVASMDGVNLFLTGRADPEAIVYDRREAPRPKKGIVLEVDDLEMQIASMKKMGFRFRNEVREGPGGRWMRLEDPDGNPVDLFEMSSETQEQS